MFNDIKKLLILILFLVVVFTGCSTVQNAEIKILNGDKPPSSTTIRFTSIPQSSITGENIANGTYIKDVDVKYNGACEEGWQQQDVYSEGIVTLRLCVLYNENDIGGELVKDYHFAQNTYIKNLSISGECGSGWIEKNEIKLNLNGGFGCAGNKEYNFKLCALYNGNESVGDNIEIPSGSITEYHVSPGTLIENILITSKECTQEDSELENLKEVTVANTKFNLCVDYSDEDIESGYENRLCPEEIIQKEQLEGTSAKDYCAAQGKLIKNVECLDKYVDRYNCFDSLDKDFNNYEELDDDVQINISCCWTPDLESDDPYLNGRALIEQAVQEGIRLDELRDNYPDRCEAMGEEFEWDNEEIGECKKGAQDAIDELDTGRTELYDIPPGAGTGPKSQECDQLEQTSGIPTEGCIYGCCGQATGVVECCYLDEAGTGVGCQVRPQETVNVPGIGEIMLEYVPLLNKFKVWLDVKLDENNIATEDPYSVEAGRIGNSNTFEFTDLNGVRHSFISELTNSCSDVISTFAVSNRCITKSDELPSSPNFRVSCGTNYAIAGLIIDDYREESQSKRDVKVVCCPLVANIAT